MSNEVIEFDREDDDFLQFWDEHEAKQEVPTTRILGVDVPIPHDIPLAFEKKFEELKDSEDVEDVKRLLKFLFVEDVLDRWTDHGLTSNMLQVLLAWGMSNASGKEIDFAEAAELVEQAKRDKAANEGKAPTAINRAGRRARASSKTRASAGTGGSSKPTSRANTA